MSAEKDREPLSAVLSQSAVPAGAVFLSYASEDAAAAERIAAALRTVGIEVWFDKTELRGGDAWDRLIRQQIHDCRLFIAVISAHTEARDEGYFRREWKLAVDRTDDMAEGKPFLVPVVIDAVAERGASVPERFRELQWTRLPAGETAPAFVERVRRLLSPAASAARSAVTLASSGSPAVPTPEELERWHVRSKLAAWSIGAVLVVGLGYFVADRFWFAKHSAATLSTEKASASTNAPAATAAAFHPPPHSVAVLPFVNMSGDKDQEYFSEGLTEELLNSLSRINELQVAARTSSFSFQGEHPDIGTVAHKLNVGAVLEGSVRRSANTVRITAQLVNGITGFHIWSQSYDRDLGNVLQLQTDIATAVASALKVTLLGDEAAKIEVGGTRNPSAFDAYLRASKAYWAATTGATHDKQAAIAEYTEVIDLDPDYALAYAARSIALANLASDLDTPRPVMRVSFDKARTDARKAIALAPDLAEGHLALAQLYELALEFTQSTVEYERALALAPGNARVLRDFGVFAVSMGRMDFGLTLLHRALLLDPLNLSSHTFLGDSLLYLRRYDEAMAAFKGAKALVQDERSYTWAFGVAHYLLGDLQAARSFCEANGEKDESAQFCLALTYDKMGRRADAEAMLEKIRARVGDSGAMDYSDIYAQWGNKKMALEWLETAMRLHDPQLEWLRLDPFADPLRNEPRFQAIERALKFPD